MKRQQWLSGIRWASAAAIATAVSPAITACHQAPYVSVQQLPKETLALQPGLIAPGDVIEMRVFGQDSLSTRGVVRQDGMITLPLLGAVKAAGETQVSLAAQTAERLKPYVNSPQVTVAIQESLVSVAIVGEIRQAGVLQLESPATVLHALAKAGGMTEFADTNGIFVLRKLSGVVQRIRFSYDALIAADPASIGFQLRTGDVVVIE
jgi:polysaccharide export outer membrane protein